MTKKHYIKIAKIFADAKDEMEEGLRVKMILRFCEMFKEDNQRFDAGRFMDAAYIGKEY